jgi:SAM-dependent methyltransferase
MGKTHTDEGALRWLQEWGVRSVLDIGCGPGGQVEAARGLGMQAMGIDGDPACNPDLLHDFTTGIAKPADVVGFKYDAVWCVEFLEHVHEKFLWNVLATIVLARPRIIVAAAAPPGKRGHHHVNCQPQEYWEQVFANCGYRYTKMHTDKLRKASTMVREFIPQRGMVFIKSVAQEGTDEKN